MNALNVGRIKLGVAVTGAAKKAINYAVGYANERKQFKVPIASFGAFNTNWQKWPQKPTWQMPVIIEQDKT